MGAPSEFSLSTGTGGGREWRSALLVAGWPVDRRPQSWSPDGRFLILETRAQSRQNSPEISVLPLTGDSKPFSFLEASYATSGGQLSPDGRWLAYVSNEPGRPEVYVTPFPQAKGKWQVSSERATTPRWRRDGRELFFCRIDGVLMAADVAPGKDSFVVGSIKPLSERRVFQTPSTPRPMTFSPMANVSLWPPSNRKPSTHH